MNIFINTIGSRGDVQPFVALGQGLRAAGHAVTLCTSARFQPFIEAHGLTYAYMNDGLMDLMDSAQGRAAMEDTSGLWGWIKTYVTLMKQAGPLQRLMLEESWTAAQRAEPDLILYHSKAFWAPFFADVLDCPAALCLLQPLLVPTAETPAMGFPEWDLGPAYNHLTYKIIQIITALATDRYAKPWREAHGVPPRPRGASILHRTDGAPIPVLHAYSPHVVPIPSDWPPHATATGFWLLDDRQDWAMPPALRAFLSKGPPPVFVGFGSMAGRDPQRLGHLVVQALEAAGARGVLARGWGGLEASDLPASIHMIDGAPYDVLFPHMAAVVHHGGAGTTAAGLRAGRPAVICPFFGDQPFWGRRVEALGVGSAPIPQKKLTAEKLAAAIRAVTTRPAVRQAAERLGEELRAEDGVARAVEILEKDEGRRARVER